MPRVENRIPRACGFSTEPVFGEDDESRLNISVVFTAVESTLAALRHAGSLASKLDARISLIVPQVVPYPLPLQVPPILPAFNARRFSIIAGHSRVETKVELYLCRDPMQTLKSVLKPHSLVVVGGQKTWRPTPEKRLAAGLRRAGHEVIFSEME